MSDAVDTLPARRSDRRFDAGFVLLILLLICVTRMPFASRALYHYDSVVFALAMDDYNPQPGGAPHPPGYLFYIGVAKLFRFAFVDRPLAAQIHTANDALVLTSIVFEFLTVVALYRFCRHAFNRTYGVVASLALLFSPLFWFYGEVGLSYPIESFFGALVAGLLYRAASGNRSALYWAAALIALLGGFRTFATLMLLPLLAYTILLAHRRPGRILLVGLLMGVVGLTWLVPSIYYGGGIQYDVVTGHYSIPLMDYSDSFWKRFLSTTSVFYGAGFGRLVKQVLLMAETCFSAGWFFAFPVAALLATRAFQWWFRSAAALSTVGLRSALGLGWGKLSAAARRNDPFLFISIIIVPTLFYLLLLHFSQRGHIFLFLPFLFIPVVRALELFAVSKRRILILTAIGLSVNTVLFFTVAPLGTPTMTSEARNGLLRHSLFRVRNNLNNWVLNTSLPEIQKHDRMVDDFRNIRNAGFGPKNTVYVTKYDRKFANLFTQSFYPYVRYYCPDYVCYEVTAEHAIRKDGSSRVTTLKRAFGRSEETLQTARVELPEGTRHIVWYIAREILAMSMADSTRRHPNIVLHHNTHMRFTQVAPGEPVPFGGHEFVLPVPDASATESPPQSEDPAPTE